MVDNGSMERGLRDAPNGRGVHRMVRVKLLTDVEFIARRRRVWVKLLKDVEFIARRRRSFRRGGVVGRASTFTLEGRYWPMSGDTEEPRRFYWLTIVEPRDSLAAWSPELMHAV